MSDLVPTDALIDRLERDLIKENESIARAVADRQVGDGHWHRRALLERRLRTARALSVVLQEGRDG